MGYLENGKVIEAPPPEAFEVPKTADDYFASGT
jgi:hypothetical protein